MRVIAVNNPPAFTVTTDHADSRPQLRSQASRRPVVDPREIWQQSPHDHASGSGDLTPTQMAVPRLPKPEESSEQACQPRQQALPAPYDDRPALLNHMIDLLQHIVTSTTMLRQHA